MNRFIAFVGIGVVAARMTAAAEVPKRIVFLGDSITDEYTYPQLIRQALVESGRPPAVCINAGVGGDMAESMFARIDRDVLAQNPELVTVSAGVNDALSLVPPAKFEKQVGTICERLRAADVPVLIFTTSLIGPKFAYTHSHLVEYNAALRRIAAEHHYALAEVNEPMELAFARGESVLDADEVHPNRAGHRIIARAALDALGCKDVPLPEKLRLELMPGVIPQWRLRAVSDDTSLSEQTISALSPDRGEWKPVTLPEREPAPTWWLNDERARGFAVALPKSVAPGKCFQGVAHINSEKARRVVFSTGAQLRTIWLNGKLIFKHQGWTGWHAGKERIPAELKPGQNTVVIESGDTFFLSVTDGRES